MLKVHYTYKRTIELIVEEKILRGLTCRMLKVCSQECFSIFSIIILRRTSRIIWS